MNIFRIKRNRIHTNDILFSLTIRPLLVGNSCSFTPLSATYYHVKGTLLPNWIGKPIKSSAPYYNNNSSPSPSYHIAINRHSYTEISQKHKRFLWNKSTRELFLTANHTLFIRRNRRNFSYIALKATLFCCISYLTSVHNQPYFCA